MSKDQALEELFLAQKPHFDDKADFMAKLTRRLDAVEYVRQHQEATIRRYGHRLCRGCRQRSHHLGIRPFHASRHATVHRQHAIRPSRMARRELTCHFNHHPRLVDEFRHDEHHQQYTRHPEYTEESHHGRNDMILQRNLVTWFQNSMPNHSIFSSGHSN